MWSQVLDSGMKPTQKYNFMTRIPQKWAFTEEIDQNHVYENAAHWVQWEKKNTFS